MIKEEKVQNLMEAVSADIPQMKHLYKNLFSRGKELRTEIVYQVADSLNISRKKKRFIGPDRGVHFSPVLYFA